MTTEVSFFGADPEEEEKKAEQARKYFGLYSGKVSPIPDPLPLSRVGVVMDSFDPIDTLAWCRVAAPMAGVLHGTYFIPSPGDEVLVAFENGDLHSPIIIGSVHNATNLPPVPYPVAQIRAIRTPLGNQLVFNEALGTVALQAGPTPPVAMPAPPVPTAPYSSVSVTPGNVTVSSPGPIVLTSATSIAFQVGDTVITLTPAGITISGKVIAMQGSGPITINAPIVKIN